MDKGSVDLGESGHMCEVRGVVTHAWVGSCRLRTKPDHLCTKEQDAECEGGEGGSQAVRTYVALAVIFIFLRRILLGAVALLGYMPRGGAAFPTAREDSRGRIHDGLQQRPW